MRRLPLTLLVLFLAGAAAEAALGQFPRRSPFQPSRPAQEQQPRHNDSRDRVTVEVHADRPHIEPGGEAVIAVVFEMDDRWKIWAGDRDLGNYIDSRIYVEAPEGSGVTAHRPFIQWPPEKEIDFLGERLPVYEGRAIAYVPVTVAEDAASGAVELTVRPVYQACDDRTCLNPTPMAPAAGEPPVQRWLDYGYPITLEIVEETAPAEIDEAVFGAFDPAVWEPIRAGAQIVSFWFFDLNVAGPVGVTLLLLIAALGGFILNFTPCVLPVIPIKIMSLSQTAGNRARCFVLGAAMFLGVVALWLAIGIGVAGFGVITSTNELFQYPAFTITVGAILVAMAVGMCGLFSMRLPNWVYSINPRHDSLHGSFGFGVMTGILALPCTAPFMGAAIAVAAAWQPLTALTVFAAIGIGMALPYLVLSTFPGLIDRLPRTGPGSELLKQVMGLLILAAAAYFLGVGLSGVFVTPPDPPSLVYWWTVAALVAAAGGWLAWRTIRIAYRPIPRVLSAALGLALIVTAGYGAVRLTDKGPIEWLYYTPERFEEQTASGNVVVLEFTAEWCLNCKWLERQVLFTPDVRAALDQPDVTPMKIDLTGRNPLGNEKLNAVGRHSIPLLVVFGPGGAEVFKEDWYTAGQVISAIDEARGVRVVRR